MNFQTYLALIKREYYETRNSLFWISLLTLIILLFQALPNMLSADPVISFGLDGGKSIYFCFGVLVASYAFWEFKFAGSTQAYLLVPASPLEKIAAKLTYYILGWLILFILCFMLAHTATIVKLVLIGSSIPVQSITAALLNLMRFLLWVTVIQSITVFAGCYFKRKVLVKLFCVYIVAIIPIQYCCNSLSAIWAQSGYGSSLTVLIQICATLGVWFLTWLCLKETEVK